MMVFRLAKLVFLLYVALDLFDPAMPGVFFVQHDDLFVDALTRPHGSASGARALRDDVRRPVIPARDDLRVRTDGLAGRVVARDDADHAWQPAARRIPPGLVAGRSDPDPAR